MKVEAATLIDKSYQSINRQLEKKLANEYRKILHANESTSQCREVNTFVFLSAQASPKIEKQKVIEKIQTGIVDELLRKYYILNKSNLQKQLRKKQELIETSKIVREFIEEIDQKKLEEFDEALKKISQELPTLLFHIHSKSYVTIWEMDENNEYRLSLPAFDSPFFKTNTLPGVEPAQIVERLAVLNFFQVFLEPTSTLLKNLNTSLEKLKIEIQKPHAKTNNQKTQAKFELFLQIIYAKLSALHDMEKTINRVFELFQEVQKSIAPLNLKNEKMDLKKEISRIYTQIIHSKNLLREVTNRLQHCKIRDYLDPTKNNVITCQTNEEFKGKLKQLSELSINLFVEAELLKMWSDIFGADLPYFSYNSNISEQEDQKYQATNCHLISVRGLIKNYYLGKTTVYALRGVNLDIGQGEFVAIVGNSGAGKTTLLNCMAGLDTPDRGLVMFKGKSLHQMTDKEKSKLRLLEMGFIFQSYALLPHYTAQENVELPAVLAQKNKDLAKRMKQLLGGVGISSQARQFPAQLSGGQMQRVAIARALTNYPTVIFADEPTGDLDSQTGKQVMELLKKFHEETKTTIILITHEQNIADYAQRQITLEDGVVRNSLIYEHNTTYCTQSQIMLEENM